MKNGVLVNEISNDYEININHVYFDFSCHWYADVFGVHPIHRTVDMCKFQLGQNFFTVKKQYENVGNYRNPLGVWMTSHLPTSATNAIQLGAMGVRNSNAHMLLVDPWGNVILMRETASM